MRHRLVGWLLVSVTSGLNGRLIGGLNDRLISGLDGRQVGRLNGRLTGGLNGRLSGRLEGKVGHADERKEVEETAFWLLFFFFLVLFGLKWFFHVFFILGIHSFQLLVVPATFCAVCAFALIGCSFASTCTGPAGSNCYRARPFWFQLMPDFHTFPCFVTG